MGKPESTPVLRRRRAGVLATTIVLLTAGLAAGPAAAAAPSSAADLPGCPELRRGHSDPVAGKDCVRALQLALRQHGFAAQPVTGRFLARTEQNLIAFQRANGIRPAHGIAGPLTRKALADGTVDLPSGEPSPPVLTRSDYAHVGVRSWTGYSVFLRRSTTREYAQWLEQHPGLGSVASSTLVSGVCKVLKLARPATFLCELIGGFAADGIARQLQVAARQDACLRVSVGLRFDGITPKFVQAVPDNGDRCVD